MKQSRAALEALAGRGNGEATSQEWESVSMSSSEGGAQAGAMDQKPTMEIRASLGEFAIFVSGRVRDNWWPADSDGVRVTVAWNSDYNIRGIACSGPHKVTSPRSDKHLLSWHRKRSPLSQRSMCQS